jgi:hypoxanthine-DNA glycosylase
MSADNSETPVSVGFPPIARHDARILILGTLPSVRSLAERQYYAHPKNAFWPIMCDIAGAEGSYAERCQALLAARIAVWDVLRHSVRPGSMDADIRLGTSEANDFRGFLHAHPLVEKILFNGKTAERMFRRLVDLGKPVPAVEFVSLPSTSPAHAALPVAEKLARWRRALL